ncbi:MAG: JAB domain-containing protein [Clostridia bacterium]|nr:JAB domain-containing protein [Clostridia bacterium]NCC43382.1 JAB domain-containing protein [Clostridia bacterium]
MYENRKINEMPIEERPYEKCILHGPGALSDSELLAVIIRSGTAGRSSVELAKDVLEGTKSQEGLLGIHHMSMQELMDIKGIGQVKAIQIKCIGELSKRIAQNSAKKLLDFQDPDTIAAYYMEQLRHEEQEQMICMMLDTKNHFLGDEVISRGTVNASLVSPRNLILAAMKYHAVYIILVHNHPSGNPEPSKEDVLLTKRVREACSLVDIPLLDHIIIGDQEYISFREEGILC